MKILFLSTLLPVNEKTGGEIASNAFIKALRSAGHDVVVLAYQRKGDAVEIGNGDFSICERYIESSHSKIYSFFWLIRSFIKSMPYSSGKYYSKAYIDKMEEHLDEGKYDLVIIDHSQLGWLTNYLPVNMDFIFIAHNIEFHIYEEQSNQNGPPMKWLYQREARLIKAMENRLAMTARMAWVFTESDYDYFSNIRGRSGVEIIEIPSKFTVHENINIQKEYDVCMLGSWTWKPNMDGLKWFLDNVYPLLPESFKVMIAGKGADFLSNSYHNIKYCGYVEDAYDFMTHSKVIAIPSVSGGGIQIKTLDAISTGIPVVATTFAMRGIGSYPSSVRVSDSPEDFAASLVEVVRLTDKEVVSDEALEWAENRKNSFFSRVATSIKIIEEESTVHKEEAESQAG